MAKVPVRLVALALVGSAAQAETIAGRASVIDGDTLEIHGERIRLLDVDAPESRQKCKALSGNEWSCGQWAANKLAEWIGQLTVTCETTRKDQYGRWLAHCHLAGVSIANWLVGHGWAVPYRDCKCEEVRALSKEAELRNAGIWGGEFMMPWEWRKPAKAEHHHWNRTEEENPKNDFHRGLVAPPAIGLNHLINDNCGDDVSRDAAHHVARLHLGPRLADG